MNPRYQRGWVLLLARVRRQCLIVVAAEGLVLAGIVLGLTTG